MFLNILNFCRVNELIELQQIDIADYGLYVDFNPKRMVGLSFLEVI